MPPCRGFWGKSNCEETLRQTQSQVEGINFHYGLGAPWDSPGGTRKLCWRQGRLGCILRLISGKQMTMDGWMVGWMALVEG